MEVFNQTSTDKSVKSFWQRPEGFTGKLILGALLLAGAWFANTIMVFLGMLLANTLYTVMLAVALFALLYVLFDPKWRTLFWYLYKLGMKKLTGFVIQTNPIEIIKAFITSLEEKKAEMDNQLFKLKGQIGILGKQIADNSTNANNQVETMKAAQNRLNSAGDEQQAMKYKMQINLASREAGRLTSSNNNLVPIKTRMEKMYSYMQKIYEASDFMIQDMKSEVRNKEIEYKAIKSAYGVMRTASSIMSGDTNKRQMFEQAMEFVSDDMGHKVGEIDRFMEMSNNIINNIDLENDVFQEKGLKMLEEMDKQDFSALLLPTVIPTVTDNGIKIVAPNKATGSNNKFGELIK